MRLFLATILIIVLFTSFRKADPIARLTCRSESGRTLFNAELPSLTFMLKAEFIIDSAKLTFSSQDASDIIFDPDNKVFTICLESPSEDPKAYKFLKFWGIPSSFRKIKSKKGPDGQYHDSYQFRAKMFGTEPRPNDEFGNTKTIVLNCTLDYE